MGIGASGKCKTMRSPTTRILHRFRDDTAPSATDSYGHFLPVSHLYRQLFRPCFFPQNCVVKRKPRCVFIKTSAQGGETVEGVGDHRKRLARFRPTTQPGLAFRVSLYTSTDSLHWYTRVSVLSNDCNRARASLRDGRYARMPDSPPARFQVWFSS